MGVQPQTPDVPPPPQVSGDVQSLLVLQPHTPLMHALPAVEDAHAMPQPPQLFGSVSSLLQVPSHTFSPVGQAQMPFEHDSPVAGHVAALPHW